MTSLRYVFNSIFTICGENTQIIFVKIFKHSKSPPSRSVLREQDLNQQLMLYLEKRVSFLTPSPKSCTGWVRKPKCSKRFWTELPLTETEWRDRWNDFWTHHTYCACLHYHINKTLPLQLEKLHFTWHGSFIVRAWPGTNTYTWNISPGPTGSSERYHKQCPEARGWHAFLCSPWSHCLSAASGKWDRIHEDQWNEKNGRDSINVLPCFHEDSADEGKKDCFLTWTSHENEMSTENEGNEFSEMARHTTSSLQKFKSICYIGSMTKNKTDNRTPIFLRVAGLSNKSFYFCLRFWKTNLIQITHNSDSLPNTSLLTALGNLLWKKLDM